MTTDGEREVMGLMLTTNAQMVAAVLRGEGLPQSESLMAAIAATRTLGLLVEDTLRALVRQARARGATWAEIGEILHVTRQAAFQRFGGQPADVGVEEDLKPLPEAGAKAVEIVKLFLARKWDELLGEFDQRCREASSIELFESTLASGRATYGELMAWGTPTIAVRADYTVVDVPMAFEKGDLNGRVAFNADGQVAGLFFLPPDQP